MKTRERGMHHQILDLLQLFAPACPDQETNSWVIEVVDDKSRWSTAHDVFNRIRDRLLRATGDAGRPPVPKDRVDYARVYQYAFEELCLKSIFNQTDTNAPFDADSPFFVAGSAFKLAHKLGISAEKIIEVIAPVQ
jgi:hypothetical protein